MNKTRIACCQMDVIPGKVKENLDRIEKMATDASKNDANLVVFPEVATSDYYVAEFGPLAAPVPGKQSDIISQIASKNRIHIAVGLLEKTKEGMYNISVLFSPKGEIIGTYQKTHLSVDSRNGTIAKEVDVFLPGNDLHVFSTTFGTVGMMICKDGEYPEVPRVLAVKGAEIILWMTNRGGVNQNASIHYASSNRTVLVVANRAKGHANGGQSAIFDWQGKVLCEAGEAENIIMTDIDMDTMRERRKTYWKENRVRRPELYKILGK